MRTMGALALTLALAATAAGQSTAHLQSKANADAAYANAQQIQVGTAGSRDAAETAKEAALAAKQFCQQQGHMDAGIALLNHGDLKLAIGDNYYDFAWDNYAAGVGLHTTAYSYWFLGDYATAASYYDSAAYAFDMSVNHNGLGGDFVDATSYYNQARQKYEEAQEEFLAGAGM